MTYSDTTEERFHEMLDILPPAAYHNHMNRRPQSMGFLVGEPIIHRPCKITGCYAPTYDAFFYTNKRYRIADEAMTVREFQHVTVAEVTA